MICISMLLRVGIASIPLERDEGEYAYIAQRWLAGDVPYQDSFNQKPPGPFLAYAALFALGARSIESVHWLAHVSVVGTMVFLYFIGYRLFSRVVGWTAALFLVVLVMDRTVLGNAANTEVFAILPMTAGMFLAVRERPGRLDSLWVGVCGGLALLCKQVVVPVVVLMVAVLAFRRWIVGPTEQRAESPANAKETSLGDPSYFHVLSLFLVGLGLVLIPVCIFFAAKGAWTEFCDGVLLHNLSYSVRVPLRLYPWIFWQMAKILSQVFAPIIVLAAFGLYAAWKRLEPGMLLCLGWFVMSLAAVSVGGYFRAHYFILMMPALALMGAHGACRLGVALEPKRVEWQPAIGVALGIVAALWPLYASHHYYWAESPEEACRDLYGINPFVESRAVAKLLEENSSPDDRIFICGSEPQMLFYANRASASRYIFVYPLFVGAADSEARQQQVVDEVLHSPPKFIVIVNDVVVPTSFSKTLNASQLIFRELGEFVQHEYEPFAASTLASDWSTRIIDLVPREEGPMIGPNEDEAVVLWVWKRKS